MGLRSLIEISHDSTSRFEADPTTFVADIVAYVRGGGRWQADALFKKYDAKVVALRHSSDQYYIPSKTDGFPSKLPWDDFEKEREIALAKAKDLTSGNRKSKAALEEMITALVGIIERQQEVLDAD